MVEASFVIGPNWMAWLCITVRVGMSRLGVHEGINLRRGAARESKQ